MTGFSLAHPGMLWALLIIPAIVAWRHWRGRAPVWLVPYAAAWSPRARMPRQDWRLGLIYTAMVLLTIAAARPQWVDQHKEVVSRGYDLVLAIDLSTSMLAEDYTGPTGAPVNRLEAIRPVVAAFVTGRPNDRIGIVVFAAKAFTLAPLTSDHDWLQKQVAALRIGMLEDGTALGDGLGIALTGLESGKDKDTGSVGKFIVLLTDGANTSGSLTPPQATAIARYRKVPVFTVGAGREGMAPFPIFDDKGRRVGTRQFPSSLDVAALQAMARETDGRYLKAGDAKALAAAFKAIDASRKAQFSVKTRRVTTELFAWALGPALLCLIAAAPLWTRPRRLSAAAGGAV